MEQIPSRIELKVVLENPLSLKEPTLFANHVAISRAGTEVQFEFVAMDINLLATKFKEYSSNPGTPLEIEGKTVAKLVVPLHVFVQLEPHLQQIFAAVRQEFALNKEIPHEHRAIS